MWGNLTSFSQGKPSLMFKGIILNVAIKTLEAIFIT